MAKVSIVIPIYKVEKYLEQCLNTITNQTFSDIEIILVDDNSPDSCPKICERYEKNDKRIKVVHHSENKGLRAAVFTGMEYVTSEYVMFVDSDDYVAVNYVEQHYTALTEHDVDCVVSELSLTDINIDENLNDYKKKIYSKIDIENEILNYYFEQNPTLKETFKNSRCSKIYKTDILKQACNKCNPKVSWGEDTELNLRFLTMCDSIMITSGYAGYFYRRDNPNSITLQISQKRYNDDVLFISEIEKLARQLDKDILKLHKAFDRFIFEVLHDVKQVLNSQIVWEEKQKKVSEMLKSLISPLLIKNSSHEIEIYLNSNITEKQKYELVDKSVQRIESLDFDNTKKDLLLTNFIFRFLESSLPTNQRIQQAKRLKSKLSNKRYLLEFAKDQSIMGKVSCLLIYLGLERLFITLNEIKGK